MPVPLDAAALDAWLDPSASPSAVRPLLQSAPDNLLIGRPLSVCANSVAHDDPDCLVDQGVLL